MIRYLGVGAAYALLVCVVPYFVPFAPRATAAVWRYNRRILRRGRGRSMVEIFRHYYVFGQTIIDKIAIGAGYADRYRFEYERVEECRAVLDAGGAVMIGAHIGNWEIGAPFFEDYGSRMNIVMYDAEYEKIRETLDKYASGRNYKVIPLSDDPLESVLRIKTALDGGEYVCFQGDRFMAGADTLETRFLGADALFPAGPFTVAARMGVPVVFYFAMREKGRKYRFHFFVPDPPAKTRGGEGARALLGQYTEILEAMVRRYPRQWFNFYEFWRR